MKHFTMKNKEIEDTKINQQIAFKQMIDANLNDSAPSSKVNSNANIQNTIQTTNTLQNLYDQYQKDSEGTVEFDNYQESIETFNDANNQIIEQQNDTEEFNIENIKNDLENYLDSQNQQNFTIDQQYKNSNFGDEKTSFKDQYDTSLYEESQEKKKDPKGNLYEKSKKTKLDSCNTDNKLKYEEWIYKDENTMNGKELFDGIYAYDNMVDNFCSFGNNSSILNK